MSTVTLKQIAEIVGVSERLVAYALNGTGRVGKETREKILQEAQRLGYRPNRAARALVTGKSHMLALCLPYTATAYGDIITRLFEAKVRPTAYDLVVTRMDANLFNTPLIPIGLGQVDGIFLLEPMSLPKSSTLNKTPPIIALGAFPENASFECDSVRIDLNPASQEAVQHLCEHAPQRLAYLVGGGDLLSPNEARYTAYLTGVRQIGQEPLIINVKSFNNLSDEAAEALLTYTSQNPCPDALLCSNDEIAIGAFRALKLLGRRIPEETRVIGCDGIEYAQDLCPPLTTMEQPFEKMVENSWAFLMNRLQSPNLPLQHVTLQAQLIYRQSSEKR